MSAAPRQGMAPSGQQVELRSGGHRAVIVEVSAGLRSYAVDGRDLVDGYVESEMCDAGRGQLLVPWPNRLRDGRYQFDGQTHQVPINEPERMNAIHGLVRWESWRVVERSDAHVVMEHTIHPRPGYPFAMHLAVEYRVSEDGLACTLTASNVGERSCPYGMGAHPYLRVAGAVDGWWLQGPAATELIADERGIPVGAETVSGSDHDFRTPRRIGSSRLDTAFTDLLRGPDGRAWVRLWPAARDQGVGIWMDEKCPY